jgi:hypothetical protein
MKKFKAQMAKKIENLKFQYLKLDLINFNFEF